MTSPVERIPAGASLRLAIVTWILLSATPATAGTVAIVQPNSPTPDLTEALFRIHGELLSVGLDVKLLRRPANRRLGEAESRAWLEQIAAEGQIDAVIELVGEIAPDGADVWVIERAPRRLEVSRIALDPTSTNASETLSIRAVEVLRSTFLEKDMEAKERHSFTAPKPPPPAPPATARLPRTAPQPTTPRPTEQWGVAAGLVALTSFSRIGTAILPMAQVNWKPRSWFELQAALAGLGSRPTASSPDGSASIAQQYGTLGGCLEFDSQGLLSPFLALSAGLLRTYIEGHADLPMQGHNAEHWSFLMDGSLGLKLRMTDRYYVALAGHVQMAEPYVAVHIAEQVVATTGRPNLALTLTLGAWL